MYKLLIVEDEALCRNVLHDIVKQNIPAFSIIECASNGQQAINFAFRLRPDIILMDIEMPGIDGLAATKAIKEFLPDCRIIILTAYSSFDYAVNSLRLGAVNFLLKPFQNDDIISALNKEISHIEQATSDEPEPSAPAPSLPNSSAPFLRESIELYIKNQYADPNLSLTTIARDFGFSPSYFSKVFNIYMGATFGEYLRECRFSTAKDLLTNSQLNVNEISLHVGYTDANYFTRLFKKHEGQTPLEYRHLHLHE